MLTPQTNVTVLLHRAQQASSNLEMFPIVTSHPKQESVSTLRGAIITAIVAALSSGLVSYITAERTGIRDTNKSIEDRFLTSAKLIGDENINVRSASIIAMKEIFKDSQEKQWEIVQILANLIRVNSQSVKHPKSPKIEVVPTDVKMALDVIKNRDPERDDTAKKEKEDRIINLTRAKLYGADLEYSRLPKADFSDSDLTRVNLSNANLTGSFLRRTNLTAAILDKAILKGANIKEAILTGATYTSEQIKQACYWEQAIDTTGKLSKIASDPKEKSSNRAECKKFK
jgi:hypothetical protein